MNKIFDEYAEKYPFLKDLSQKEKSVIICMLYETSKQAYEERCRNTADDILNKI